MKIGDNVMFIGASKEQISWGGNNDPNEFLKEGDLAVIESVEVHSWHTKLYLKGIPGKFNSVSFKVVPSYINPNPKKVSEEHIKKVLHELKEKQEEERKQAQIDLNNALRDGFRCGPKC